MMRHGLFCLLVAAGSFAQGVSADEAGSGSAGIQMTLAGVISGIQPGAVQVDTPAGRLTMNWMKGLGEPAVGDRVTVTAADSLVTFELRKRDGGAVTRHRMVRGRFAGRTRDGIELATAAGARRYALADPPPDLGRLEVGGEVTAEVNDADQVRDLHPVTLGLAVSPSPQLTAGMHLKVSGTVTAMRSGLLFVKTAYGTLTAHQGAGRHDVKVGDHLVLWVDEDNYVIDVHRETDRGVHRVIRGKAAYVGDDRKRVRIATPEGPAVFDLDEGADTSTVLPPQAPVTVEINEAGRVIDIHADR